MINMTVSDWFSLVAIAISIVAIIISFISATKGNKIAEAANQLVDTANLMQMGQVEMQIRELILNAQARFTDLSIQMNQAEDNSHFIQPLESALESVCNAYDEACAKYLDGKVDKVRFKQLYHNEIRQWVEDDATKDKYSAVQSKYPATVKVYKEWNVLES